MAEFVFGGPVPSVRNEHQRSQFTPGKQKCCVCARLSRRSKK